jgi:hypothetical protein
VTHLNSPEVKAFWGRCGGTLILAAHVNLAGSQNLTHFSGLTETEHWQEVQFRSPEVEDVIAIFQTYESPRFAAHLFPINHGLECLSTMQESSRVFFQKFRENCKLLALKFEYIEMGSADLVACHISSV